MRDKSLERLHEDIIRGNQSLQSLREYNLVTMEREERDRYMKTLDLGIGCERRMIEERNGDRDFLRVLYDDLTKGEEALRTLNGILELREKEELSKREAIEFDYQRRSKSY